MMGIIAAGAYVPRLRLQRQGGQPHQILLESRAGLSGAGAARPGGGIGGRRWQVASGIGWRSWGWAAPASASVEKLKDTSYGGLPVRTRGATYDMISVTGSAPGNFAQLAGAYRARHGVEGA